MWTRDGIGSKRHTQTKANRAATESKESSWKISENKDKRRR
jgi:hypothetical protein